MKIMLPDVRLAFAQNLFTAGTVAGEGKPAFSCTGLLDPKKHAKTIAAVEAGIEAVAEAKWAGKAPAILKQMRAQDRTALHDGDTKAQYDGFEGMMFVPARSEKRPGVFDRDRSPLVAADGRPYSGCYVNMQVELWAQDNQYGKRINAQLLGVQFVRDGDSFGGGAAPADADDFADLGEDENQGEDYSNLV